VQRNLMELLLLCLKSRLDHALELYKKTDVKYIVVTGGKQPGDMSTEASASANYLD
jgi:hypothetical protein